MGVIEKLKLLFKVRKPVGAIIDQVKEAKSPLTGWKTVAFWVTLLGSLASTAAALTGVVPAPVQLVATTVLSAFYNILRGLQKAESPEIKGTLRTTEFWLSALGEVQKGFVAVHAGGINPEWMSTATMIVGMALAAGQNLAARDVKAETAAPAAESK